MGFGRIKKQFVFNKTNGHCYYCGCKIGIEDFYIDHIIPKSKGGENVIQNYAPTCFLCNAVKGPLTVEEFRDKLLRIPIKTKTLQEIFNKYKQFSFNPVIFYFEKMEELDV